VIPLTIIADPSAGVGDLRSMCVALHSPPNGEKSHLEKLAVLSDPESYDAFWRPHRRRNVVRRDCRSRVATARSLEPLHVLSVLSRDRTSRPLDDRLRRRCQHRRDRGARARPEQDHTD